MKNVFHVFSRMFTKFLGEHPFSSTHSAHLASASRLRSVRIGLALILALFAAASSWATDYITDVMVLGGDKSTISQMKSDYEQKGWIFIDDDLNDGAGGDYVHVLYKKSSSYSSNVITDIIIKTGEHPDSYIFNGRTYYRAPHDGSEYFKSYGGNLNSATTVSSSTNMRLYYTKEEFSDKRAVSKIAFTVADNNETKTKDGYTTLGRNGAVVGSDGSGALDLNEGAGSDSKYIYMHISTVQPPLADAPEYITDVVVLGGSKDEVNALKERYASQGWVVIDQDLNDGAGSGTDYVYLAYKKSPLSEDGNGFITDFIIKTDDYPDTYKFNGRTYYRTPNFGSEHFEAHGGNLNSGTRSSSTNMRLYFTREKFSDNRVVDDIAFTVADDNKTKTKTGYTTLGKDGAAVGSDGSGALDLNEGVGYTSDYIYMHFSTFNDFSTVTFVSGSKNIVIAPKLIYNGKKLDKPSDPVRPGFTFLGWFTTADGNALFDFNTPITSDVSLYAQWRWDGGDLSNVDMDDDYVARDGFELTGTLASNSKISIANGATVTLKNAVINGANNKNYTWAGLTCEGDCNIVLEKGSENKVKGFFKDYPGIYVPKGKTLTIEGSGKLDVIGGDYAAGIGGGHNISCGNIVINGGTVNATGGTYGAGIGGGFTYGSRTTTVGDITINGGTVTATSGDGEAGIGSGYTGFGATTTVGNITINGGTVTATSGYGGAGIGGGYTFNSGTATVGNITINGGTVNATGGTGGAGIGSGYTSIRGTTTVGDITINGGTVTATGGERGAGIGGGYTDDDGTTTVGDITISDRVIMLTATAGKNAPNSVGNGYVYNGGSSSASVGTVTVAGVETGPINTNPFVYSNPNVVLDTLTNDYTATDGKILTGTLGGNYKISIADGATVTLSNAVINGVDNKKYTWAGLTCEGDCKIVLDEGSENSVKGFYRYYPGIYVPEGYTLTIEGGGILDVFGGGDAAGIGGGYNISCGNIVINGGTVNATVGDYGAGIGGGYTDGSGTTTVGDIIINGGTVTATGGYYGAGIGSGRTYNNNSVTSTVGSVTSTVGNITINGGTVNATGGTYGAGIGSGRTYSSTSTVGNITINGGTVTATGGKYGAGIGSGLTNGGTATVENITIKGGTVTAQGFVGIGMGYIEGSNAKVEIGPIRLYHGFKEVDATITGKPIYMNGETDVSSNPSEYFGIDGSITRSLYSIHYAENNLNGSVKGNNTTTTGKAYAGETVTAIPDFGYSFKSLSVKDDEGNTVEVKGNSFVMPQGDVTVSADFASKYPMLTFSDNGKKVTVNGAYGGTETFELDEDITVENVVFNREFAVGVFSTLTLPFDVSTEYLEGFGMVLTFNGLKQKDDGKWVVRMKKFWEKNVTSEFKTLDAYTPYLVLMDESSLKVNTSVQILTTKEPIAKAAGSNWEFRGTLAYKKWEEGDSELGRVYGFAAESKDGIQAGQFVKAGAGAYIYPLRAYLLKKPAASGVRSSIAGGKSFATMSLPDEIDVEIEDDDGNEPKTTVVGKFNTRTGEFRMNSDAARSFDVKGRNVGNKANKARGAYYKKGGKAAVTR